MSLYYENTGRGIRRREPTAKTSEVKISSQRRWRAANPTRYMWSMIKCRARRRGIEFDLTPDDFLPLPTHCPIFGTPLLYFGESVREGPDKERTASVDRKDNSKGYVRGNILIVSLRANMLKGTATPNELVKLAAFYGKQE